MEDFACFSLDKQFRFDSIGQYRRMIMKHNCDEYQCLVTKDNFDSHFYETHEIELLFGYYSSKSFNVMYSMEYNPDNTKVTIRVQIRFKYLETSKPIFEEFAFILTKVSSGNTGFLDYPQNKKIICSNRYYNRYYNWIECVKYLSKFTGFKVNPRLEGYVQITDEPLYPVDFHKLPITTLSSYGTNYARLFPTNLPENLNTLDLYIGFDCNKLPRLPDTICSIRIYGDDTTLPNIPKNLSDFYYHGTKQNILLWINKY